MEDLMAARTWPTREEWAAQAEYAVRTACYASQRASRFPLDWLTTDQHAEARQLVEAIVKATRREINRAVRETEDGADLTAALNHRAQLNNANRSAAGLYTTVDSLNVDWSRIVNVARAHNAAPEQANRLDALRTEMLQRRDAAAEAGLAAAIEREVAKRNSDAGWAAELERRARVEAGPLVTRHPA